MLAHFFNRKREYLGTMEMNDNNPVYDNYRVPVLEKSQRPISVEDSPPRIERMAFRTFNVVPVYEGGVKTFLVFLEVSP